MDHTTRNETIRALAAATAAEVRSRPARALAAAAPKGNTIEPTFGEFGFDDESESTGDHLPSPPCTERELPLERTPNHYTGEHRDEVVR